MHLQGFPAALTPLLAMDKERQHFEPPFRVAVAPLWVGRERLCGRTFSTQFCIRLRRLEGVALDT